MNQNPDTENNEIKYLIHQQFDELKKEIKELRESLRILQSQTNSQNLWKQLALITTTILISSLVSGTIGILIGWFIRSGKLRLVIDSRPI